MTSEIPEDIRVKADKVMASLSMHNPVIADAIAKALKAERERCRLIAAGFDDGGDSGFSLAARTIERIIRQDNPDAPKT
jgi:hypothetical protein